jgi:hypothetical protein
MQVGSFKTRPIRDDDEFESLPRLVSLAFNRQSATKSPSLLGSLMDEHSQWFVFAETVTRGARVQHLSLNIKNDTGIHALVRLHAPHLVSLRTTYMPPVLLKHVRFLRFLYEQPVSFTAALDACPTLEVLWCSFAVRLNGTMASLLQALASSHVHTLIAAPHYLDVGAAAVATPNHTLRQLFLFGLNGTNGNGYKAGDFDRLLKALPNLHTCVFAPLHRQGESNYYGTIHADRDEDNKGSAAAAAAATATGSTPVSQLKQFQPFFINATYLHPGKLVFPTEASLARNAHVYAPSNYESINRGRSQSGNIEMVRYEQELAFYKDRISLQPDWAQWEAHIGKQLVAAGLSIMSPCGSCEDNRPGMFDASKHATKDNKANKSQASGASAAASAATSSGEYS